MEMEEKCLDMMAQDPKGLDPMEEDWGLAVRVESAIAGDCSDFTVDGAARDVDWGGTPDPHLMKKKIWSPQRPGYLNNYAQSTSALMIFKKRNDRKHLADDPARCFSGFDIKFN